MLVVGAWLWWGGLLGSPAQSEANDTGHTIVSDAEVSVSWELTVEPGKASSCALEALNETFSVVGWKVVQLPAAEQRTRSFTETVRTTEQSVTGLIYRCWLS